MKQQLPLHAVCLQPLPAFKWLGLEEDASPADVSNAFRKLSRTHHPDRPGGDRIKFQITTAMHKLIQDGEKLGGAPTGRNHEEFRYGITMGLTEPLAQAAHLRYDEGA